MCRVPGAVHIGWPLIDLGKMLLIVAIILLFANAATFRRWLKFSLYYIPIVLILDYFIFPTRLFPMTPELEHADGVYPFGRLYVVITFCIVAWGLYHSYKEGTKTKK